MKYIKAMSLPTSHPQGLLARPMQIVWVVSGPGFRLRVPRLTTPYPPKIFSNPAEV
jgi:hypothetical protein